MTKAQYDKMVNEIFDVVEKYSDYWRAEDDWKEGFVYIKIKENILPFEDEEEDEDEDGEE